MKKLILILIAFPLVFFACDSRADDDDDCEFRNELNDPDFPLIKADCSTINPFINRAWISVESLKNYSSEEFMYIHSFGGTSHSDLLQYLNFGEIQTIKINTVAQTIVSIYRSHYLFNDTSFKFFLPEHFLFGRIAEYTLYNDTLTINGIRFVSNHFWN